MPQPEIGALPLASQQRVVLTELLYCLTGVRGNFISPITSDSDGEGLARFETTFTIHSQLDRSLVELVQDILPLASHFMGIQKIITETDNQGQVINSLNEALQHLTHDFYVSRLVCPQPTSSAYQIFIHSSCCSYKRSRSFSCSSSQCRSCSTTCSRRCG